MGPPTRPGPFLRHGTPLHEGTDSQKRPKFGAGTDNPVSPCKAVCEQLGAQRDQNGLRAPVPARGNGRMSQDRAPRTRSSRSTGGRSKGGMWPVWSARAPRQARNNGGLATERAAFRNLRVPSQQNGREVTRKTGTGSRRRPHRGCRGGSKRGGEMIKRTAWRV